MAADKKRLPVFDQLKKIDILPAGGGSVWLGERGRYIIKNHDKAEPNRPCASVILNHKYFTGLFKTNKRGVYSADIKTGSGKTYLLFVLNDSDQLKICQKKHVRKIKES